MYNINKNRPGRVQTPPGQEDAWMDLLDRNSKGMTPSLSNLLLILENDEKLQGIAYNRLTDALEIKTPLPWRPNGCQWRDADDAQLLCYIDRCYGSFPEKLVRTALEKTADDRGFHPVQEMFRSLKAWDKTPRIETLLIDYLGAADTEYVRTVTKKMLVAAMTRVFHPGAKFDNMLVLAGPQGIGKSTLIRKLGMDWYNDDISVTDMNDKTAAEKVQGSWICEISEMAGLRKAEVEKVKAFLSRQEDKFRAAYGRRVSPHPRQCVFFGTTNNDTGFLRDNTGNRRFWVVPVSGDSGKHPWDLDDYTIHQIWAETLMWYGWDLILPPGLEEEAREQQRQALEQDDREGLVRSYLEDLIPTDWDLRDLCGRMSWYVTPTSARRDVKELKQRDRTSNMEIWCECFGEQKQKLGRKESADITAIMSRIEGWEKQEHSARRGPYGLQRIYERKKQEDLTGTQLSLKCD